MANLSERIKVLREESGLTQGEFGKLFGIVKSTVSLYESSKSTPDDDLKIRIAEHFKVTMDWLLGLSDKRTQNSNTISDPALDDLLKKVPDLTNEEKESLADHMKFAIEQIEKERQKRAKEKS